MAPSSSRKRPAENGGKGANAFDFLMGKKLATQGGKGKHIVNSFGGASRFVLCPLGCGVHVSELGVNKHLDECSGKEEREGAGPKPTPQVSQETPTPPAYRKKGDETGTELRQKVSQDMPLGTFNADKKKQKIDEVNPSAPDAFTHMMTRSQLVFSDDIHKPMRQRFHLDSDGTLSWTELKPQQNCIGEGKDDIQQKDSKSNDIFGWSASVVLKGAKMLVSGTKDSLPPRDLVLTISSEFPSGKEENERLVRRHSRFSIPVLKSILQKSIRRRKPLPSVRVAMELIDKSFSDLLRRLPIIVLEDSTLHPDFPLLVWLMIADSKGFVVPPTIMTRLLQIIYEIASCPYTDYIPDAKETPANESEVVLSSEKCDNLHLLSETLCLSSPLERFEKEFHSSSLICELTVRAMLLRAQYGGMACDIKMLSGYVNIWRKRFLLREIPDNINEAIANLPKDAPNPEMECSALKWWDVPERVHDNGRRQSAKRVASDAIEKLLLKDLSVAGIDFHCSAVLDKVLDETMFFSECCHQLELISEHIGCRPIGVDDQRSWMMDILKACMWKFSSGVNYRRPLSLRPGTTAPLASRKDKVLKTFWDETVSSHVQRYMNTYAEERILR